MTTFIYHYLIFKILVKGEKHLNKDLIERKKIRSKNFFQP